MANIPEVKIPGCLARGQGRRQSRAKVCHPSSPRAKSRQAWRWLRLAPSALTLGSGSGEVSPATRGAAIVAILPDDPQNEPAHASDATHFVKTDCMSPHIRMREHINALSVALRRLRGFKEKCRRYQKERVDRHRGRGRGCLELGSEGGKRAPTVYQTTLRKRSGRCSKALDSQPLGAMFPRTHSRDHLRSARGAVGRPGGGRGGVVGGGRGGFAAEARSGAGASTGRALYQMSAKMFSCGKKKGRFRAGPG